MYEFDLSNPKSWHNFNRPYLNPSVPVELLKIAGSNRHGQPRLRVVWGGDEQMHYEGDDVLPAGWYLKYHLCFTAAELAAYEYTIEITGEKRRVSSHISLPDTGLVQPLYRQEEIGKPRWMIEFWRDIGDCNGFYKEEGYFHLLTVQKEPINQATGMGPYREVDSDILSTLKGMIHFMENTTEAEREARRAEDDQKAKEQRQKAKDALWEDYEDSIERIAYEHRL